MNEPNKTKVLIADDHAIFRAGLRLLLEGNNGIKVAGECARLADLDGAIDDINPDLVLLDLRFEDGNGIDVIPQIAAKTKVLVLTADSDPDVHERCLKAGANGLVCKEIASEELFKAMQRVCDGEVWFDKRLMSKVVRDLTRPKPNGPLDVEVQRITTLSPREREVIKLVGEGLNNKAIADRLFISETTVRHHMTSILSKLDLSSRLELVVFAYRRGLAELPIREPAA